MMKKIILTVPLLLAAVSVMAMTASFSFYNENVPQAFNDISERFGVPVVVDGTVSGQVTMNLSKVTFTGAMDLLTEKTGTFYFVKDGVYFVGTPSSSSSMTVFGYETKAIPLRYLDPESAMAFLSNYSGYLTYSSNEPLLFFSGPKNVYGKVLGVLNKMDSAPSTLYVAYTVYGSGTGSYAFGNSHSLPESVVGIFSGKGFTSVSSGKFEIVSRTMNFVANGFAAVQTGKTSKFEVKNPGMVLRIKPLSGAGTGVNLALRLTESGSVTVSASSVLSVGTDRVAVIRVKEPGKNYVVEVSAVRSSSNVSGFASLVPKPARSDNVFLYGSFGFSTSTAVDVSLGYGWFAAGFESGFKNEAYAGITARLATGLRGYLTVGTGLPFSNMTSSDAYTLNFDLLQTPQTDGFMVSSGILKVSAPIASLSDLSISYGGKLEFRFGGALAGGGFSYSYRTAGNLQNLSFYLSGGWDFGRGNVLNLTYSPVTGEYGVEAELGV